MENIKKKKTVKKKTIDRSKWPIIAICYDFDRTLSPKNMQEYGFIQNLGMTAQSFWIENTEFAKKHGMDQILSYMYLMVSKASSPDADITKKQLSEHGSKIELFKGVSRWFNLIRKIGDSLNINIEHYIISSGIKEMIEGCRIKKELKHIYASSFAYKNKNIPMWPSRVINATNKTQYLFRINKGCLEENDDEGLNKSITQSNRRVPFNHMIYIGDSETDIPCMTLVKRNGGYSIGVYDPNDNSKGKGYELIRDNRINFFAPADYSKDKELYIIIDHIIHKIQSEAKLNLISKTQKNEQEKFDLNMNINKKLFSLFMYQFINEKEYEKLKTIVEEKNFAILKDEIYYWFVPEFKSFEETMNIVLEDWLKENKKEYEALLKTKEA